MPRPHIRFPSLTTCASIALSLSLFSTPALAVDGEAAAPAAGSTPAPASAAAPASVPKAAAPQKLTQRPKPAANRAEAEDSSEADEVEPPASEYKKLLTELTEESGGVQELRTRVGASSGKETDLLIPQLRELQERYRLHLINGTERYLALLAEEAEATEAAKQEAKEAAEEEGEAKPEPRVSAEATGEPGPSEGQVKEAALLASEKKDLKTFLLKELAVESLQLQKSVKKHERLFQKGVREIEATAEEEKEDLRDEIIAAFKRRTDRLVEWDAILSSLDSLDGKTGPAKSAFEKLLTASAQSAEAVLHVLAERLQKLEARHAPTEGDETKIEGLVVLRDKVAGIQQQNIELMDAHELPTTDLKQSLISTTGKMSKEVLDAEVAKGLLKEWREDATEWIKERASMLAFKGVSVVLILLAFWILARVTQGIARRALGRSSTKMSSLAVEFGVRMTGRGVFAVGIVLAASQLGIEVGPLLAGLGIAGFVIGFALQSTLSNFASGIMILMYRPFDVGHVIEAGGEMGTVKAMNLVSTTILTFDNQVLMVPNNKIWGDVIRNVTHQPERRIDLVFGIGYSDDIDKAEGVLQSILDDHELVLKEPESNIKLHELGDSSVNFIVRPWVKTDDYWAVYWDITREVKKRFDAEGISIPFPQRDVHIHQTSLPAGSQTE